MKIIADVTSQTEHAIYFPAIQPMYAQGVMKKAPRRLPAGASMADLNFFTPGSKFLNLDAGLYSAGQIKDHKTPPPCMVRTRARGKTQTSIVMGDSGGYQIATDQIYITPRKREEIFQWLVDTCDLAMTLDVPTVVLDGGKSSQYRSFDDCLMTTLGHLAEFKALGAEHDYFLNVLQGRTLVEGDDWYDAVKHYNFYGWAISGTQKETLKHLLWRVLHLIQDGKFDRDETWLHFLGISDLKTAVLLTTLRDTLRRRFPACSIHVSYDTSTPFLLAGKFLSALDRPNVTPNSLCVPSYRIDKASWANSHDKFPYSFSTISQCLRKRDIVRKNWKGGVEVDALGYLMLANHNVEVYVASVDVVNKLLKSGQPKHYLQQHLPYHLLEAVDAIDAVMSEPTLPAARAKLLDKGTLRVLDNSHK